MSREQQSYQLLGQWNQTQANYPLDRCIHQLFEHQVEQTPDAVAVVFEAQQLTYGQLNDRANQLAHYLQSLGVGPDVLVGLLTSRSLEMVVGLLGILKAGGAYVPFDPAYPQARLHGLLEDASVPVLLTQSEWVKMLPQNLNQVVLLDSSWFSITLKSRHNPTSNVTANHLAYVIYTSGSTGKPKGVLVPHRGLLNLVFWHQENFRITAWDRTTQIAGNAFDACGWELWPYLAVGATIYLGKTEIILDPTKLRDWLISKQITITFIPTPLAEKLLTLDWPENIALRTLLTGGDKLYHFPNPSIPFELVNNYGPTENTVVTTSGRIKPRNKNSSSSPNSSPQSLSPPIGRPIANTQIYLLSQDLEPVPMGMPGEIHIGGAGLAQGYLNRPDLTAEKFIANPFKHFKPLTGNFQSDRLYKTGDLARYTPDGNLEFLGRIDNQVKIRGFRIEIGEVEATLAQHPQVFQGVVIVHGDKPGDKPGDKYLVAYVVPRLKLTLPHLRDFIKAQLPYYMVPSRFLLLEAMPLTANGKIDREALSRLELARVTREIDVVAPRNFIADTKLVRYGNESPPPAGTHFPVLHQPEKRYIAPRNRVEQQLELIWAKVLDVSGIGIDDNFIELGRHSLLASEILTRLSLELQVELSLGDLFECPTIAQLADRITTANQGNQDWQTAPIRPISCNYNLPLSWGQKQIWFLVQLLPSLPVYNEPSTIYMTGFINGAVLEQSLNAIIERHEILRTTFGIVNGQLVQVISPPSRFVLPTIDLRALPAPETEATRLATEEVQKPFDLTQGPLLRATLMQFGEQDFRLYLTFHHIIMDGISLFTVLLPELAKLYQAFSQAHPPFLPALSIQYADFASWQQGLNQKKLEKQLDYWQNKLKGPLPVLQLPTDRPRPNVQTFRGAVQPFVLSQSLTKGLNALSKARRVTRFVTLLTAFKILLYRYTGQLDIVVGTVTGNRSRPETQAMIGYFLNTLVLRSDLSGFPSFLQLLDRVGSVCLEAYAHQDLPFEQLVATLQPQRNLSQNPLFQVAFVLEPPLPEIDLNWHLSQLDIHTGTAKFDLTFELDERPEGMIGRIEYSTDLFDADRIDRLISDFQTLLRGIVANPNQTIAELPLLTENDLLTENEGHSLPVGSSKSEGSVNHQAQFMDRPVIVLPSSNLERDNKFVAPQSPMEKRLAVAWINVLGLGKVSVNDNFFDQGGNSLQAAILVSQLSDQLKLEISVKLLFDHPTIGELALGIEQLLLFKDQSQILPPLQFDASSQIDPRKIREISPTIQLESQCLFSRFARGEILSIDSVALGYIPLEFLQNTNLSRQQILADWFDDSPLWYCIMQTQWGRIGCFMLPIFADQLYRDSNRLVDLCVEALKMARKLGAKTVSLTGLIPSATDYGCTLARAIRKYDDLPQITTGHATTCATVVLTIRKILQVSQRSLAQENIAFIGLGSVGMSTLYLMLRSLPHPAEITLCDVYNKLEFLQQVRQELVSNYGFRGQVWIATSTAGLSSEIYDKSLIVGATNIPNVLDINRVKPGTLIVDDSGPHCFSSELAIYRFETYKDILFTEGGMLQAPEMIKTVVYFPESIARHLDERLWQSYTRQTNPYDITGCVMSSLLSTRFGHMESTVGLLEVETCVKHYQGLEKLGFQAADLHCDGYKLRL
jgi:amino acid adenylation domain-containing protein